MEAEREAARQMGVCEEAGRTEAPRDETRQAEHRVELVEASALLALLPHLPLQVELCRLRRRRRSISRHVHRQLLLVHPRRWRPRAADHTMCTAHARRNMPGGGGCDREGEEDDSQTADVASVGHPGKSRRELAFVARMHDGCASPPRIKAEKR